jgi:hypothetical protein
MLWRREKLAPSGNRNPAVQPIAIPTELSHFNSNVKLNGVLRNTKHVTVAPVSRGKRSAIVLKSFGIYKNYMPGETLGYDKYE